jgi:uncharacterized protein
MPGETNLALLLRTLEPVLHPDEFVFCSAADACGVDAIGTFCEAEGTTLICRRSEAERAGLPFAFPCRMITLNVHSSLEAVGLLAAVTGQLARRGIAVNAVSAWFHDHLFVAPADAPEAMAALAEISRPAWL